MVHGVCGSTGAASSFWLATAAYCGIVAGVLVRGSTRAASSAGVLVRGSTGAASSFWLATAAHGGIVAGVLVRGSTGAASSFWLATAAYCGIVAGVLVRGSTGAASSAVDDVAGGWSGVDGLRLAA
jgi:hypothetical protein